MNYLVRVARCKKLNILSELPVVSTVFIEIGQFQIRYSIFKGEKYIFLSL